MLRSNIAIVLAVCLSACGSANDFTAPISKFQTATTETAAAYTPIFTAKNSTERHFNFVLAQTRNQPIDNDTIKNAFSPADIQVRVDAFQVINDYATALATVAGSQDKSQFSSSIDTLKTSIDNLKGSFSSSSKSGSLDKYSGPIAGLVQFIGTTIINHERVVILRSAINDGAPYVEKLMSFLKKDLKDAYNDQREVLLTDYGEFRKIHNKHPSSPVSDLEKTYNEYDLLSSQSPVDAIGAMEKAFAALKQYAADFNNPKNFHQFVAAVDVFATKATQALKVANELKSA